ncbi:MAG: VWA domain-containing protein [Acidobacteria bacterium]|nr:VWA domain-containing protein [Acidobacteriota bacterium]
MRSTFNRGGRGERGDERKGRWVLFFLCGLSVLCGYTSASSALTQDPQQPPRFQSSVEVTSLDVAVVDDRGKPIADLTPADFVVRIEGNPRRVVSAEWVSLVTPESATAPTAPPEGFSTNATSTGGRLIVLAVDQPNIRFGGAMAIAKAAGSFIDRLLPADRVAVAGIGVGAPATTFTADRERVKQAITRTTGQKQSPILPEHNIALTEALAVERGDRLALDSLLQRECQNLPPGPGALDMCITQVQMEAHEIAQNVGRESAQTLQALRDLFIGLRTIDAPKTLVLISEGFILDDAPLVSELGSLAAASRTSLYVLKLDSSMFDITTSRMPLNPIGDRMAQTEGLEMLAGAARGTLFTVTGTGSTLFERIESELSGYYLLGVESDPRDRDGKPHPIRVDVPRRGALVRSRRQILNEPADQLAARAARSPRQAMVAALGSPLLASALPLRVVSYGLQGPERDRVQLLIHADIGSDYAASKVVSVGYVITDRTGRAVDTKAIDARLFPVMNGVPSPLQYSAGASLPPGDYTLKVAVAEGDRVGTVEHPIHAALPGAPGVTMSELMVGGPLDAGELLAPTIGYEVTFGIVHGYVEAYGSKADSLTMEYEVAASSEASALLNMDVPPHPAGDTRVIFTKTIPVRQLPPGKYVLRAILSEGGRSVKTLERGFEVAAPKVLMTSADGLGAIGNASTDAELFLPVDQTAMAPAFQRETAVQRGTLEPFRDRVPPAVKASFDQGVALLAGGDFTKAEASFKKAIDPDADSTAPLVYLAASFAAAGHDSEAASAWQTALIDGAEFPQIYQWLGDALMRTRDLGQARTILEEAIGKWPSDVRFTKPLAMLYGAFGRGREAVRTLERYLAARRDDIEAYLLGVQWIYTLHSSGALVHGRAEDLKLAHEYADAYAHAKGQRVPLVKQWVDYLENEKK